VLPVSADEGQTITAYAAEPGSATADALQLLASLSATDRSTATTETAAPADGAGDPEDERTF
jgi:hypothetical protein